MCSMICSLLRNGCSMPAFVALPALVAPVVARVALVQALVLVPALMQL